MVEFTNQTNYTYILNNDSISNSSNRTTQLIAKHKFSFSFKDFIILMIDALMVIGPSLGYTNDRCFNGYRPFIRVFFTIFEI